MSDLENDLKRASQRTLVGLGPVCQLGYIVPDLDEGISDWSANNVGPWTVIRNVRLQTEYLGQPSQPELHVAMAFRGAVQVELIQQTNTAPSPYLSMIQSGNYGLHHRAYLCANIGSAIDQVAKQGLTQCCDINALDGSRYAYFQPHQVDGLYEELLEETWLMKGMFRSGPKAAARWADKAPYPSHIEINLQSGGSIAASLMTCLPQVWKHNFGS